MRGLIGLLIGMSWCGLALADPALDDLPVETHSGVLRSIDLDQHVLVIGGWSFYVPLDAPVTVRGAGSALSLLAVGMKVEVTYQELPEGRKAIAIDQLPDNQTLEEF